MDKLTKLIEDAERAEQGDWHYISDPLFDSERWNGQVVISRDGRIVSRICECEEDSGVHIANMQPWNAIPILRAFKAMQESLRQIEGPQIHPEGEAMDDTAAVESMTIKAQMALEIADAAIENL